MGKWESYWDLPSYNRMMLRALAAILLLMPLASCGGNNIKTKEKVQEAIVKRLQSTSGLDLNSLDINTTSVTFDKNFAYATVAFHPKNDGNLNSGMTMNYTLKDQDGKWVVIKVGGSHGHASDGADQLPPGHPPINSTNPHEGSTEQGANGRAQ